MVYIFSETEESFLTSFLLYSNVESLLLNKYKMRGEAVASIQSTLKKRLGRVGKNRNEDISSEEAKEVLLPLLKKKCESEANTGRWTPPKSFGEDPDITVTKSIEVSGDQNANFGMRLYAAAKNTTGKQFQCCVVL